MNFDRYKWMRVWILAGLQASAALAAAPDDRLRECASAATALLSEAEIARDMAVRATENAFAARHDAEAALLATLRANKTPECVLAQAKLDKQNVAAASAAALAASVVREATVSIAAADAVRAMVQQSQDKKPAPDPVDTLKRVEKLLAEAERSLKTASASVEQLKREWLLPAYLTPEPAPEKPAPRWWRLGL